MTNACDQMPPDPEPSVYPPTESAEDPRAEQLAERAWALEKARAAVQIRGGGLLSGQTSVDASDLLRVAQWILTGHDTLDDLVAATRPTTTVVVNQTGESLANLREYFAAEEDLAGHGASTGCCSDPVQLAHNTPEGARS